MYKIKAKKLHAELTLDTTLLSSGASKVGSILVDIRITKIEMPDVGDVFTLSLMVMKYRISFQFSKAEVNTIRTKLLIGIPYVDITTLAQFKHYTH